MRIYTMTATFGKLENKTLTLQPGLNIIHAPNEWGKSTWCAFLTVMLYGLDTRAKTTKTALADKERYAPWSGSAMSGRIDLNWNGRDITIERRAKGRTPMGDFSAYETATGLPVPELTATTCGQVLLGVERSVFQRAGFIQLSDMPVTQEESLRRRLNALVTTGDESNSADELEQKLKDLKNKCRYNRSGLLPQAEAQREELEQKCHELAYLKAQCEKIKTRQTELEAFAAQLENHKQALAYEASQSAGQRIRLADNQAEAAARHLAQLEEICAQLPTEEDAQLQLEKAQVLSAELQSLQMDGQMLPSLPQPPQAPVRYQDCAPGEAVHEAQDDYTFWQIWEASKKKNGILVWMYVAAAALALALLLIPAVRQTAWLPITLAVAIGGIAVMVLCAFRARRLQNNIEKLFDRHPGLSPDKWVPEAESYTAAYEEYEAQCRHIRVLHKEHARRQQAADDVIAILCKGIPLAQYMENAREILATHQALADARREQLRAREHADALKSVAKPVQKPAQPDEMTFSEPDTLRLISDTAFELRQLHTRLGQCQGKMEALGSESKLISQLEAVNTRIGHLTKTYNALDLALQTLSQASMSLQRRFAPRISQQAQQLLSRLTGGRYNRLTLSEDLTVSTGAESENTLRPALWRSEGTMDQLYLALRLAVARELTPQAPLVLDDAFARFDDTRLQAAMEILREEAEHKQILLFTCHGREKELL